MMTTETIERIRVANWTDDDLVVSVWRFWGTAIVQIQSKDAPVGKVSHGITNTPLPMWAKEGDKNDHTIELSNLEHFID